MLTPEHKQARLAGIGGSDIGAIIGVNKYKNAHDVWLEKTGLRPSPDINNDAIHFGNIMEPVLVDEYRKRTGRTVKDDSAMFQHPERSWHLASVDGLVLEDSRAVGVLECKTANWRMAADWGEEGTDDIPYSYLVQCAWYMAALDLPWCDVVALLDRSVRIYRVPRHQDLEKALLMRAEAFWMDNVQTETPPPVDSSKSCAAALSVIHNKPDAEMLTSSAEVEDLARELRELKLYLGKLTDREREIKNELAAFVGDHRGVETAVGKVVWTKPGTRRTTAWKAVAENLGASDEIIAQHTKSASSNRQIRTYFTEEGE